MDDKDTFYMSAVPQSTQASRDDHGPGPFTCIHCKNVFASWARLTFHLAVCRERSYPRTFVIGKYKFVVRLNPLKRWVMALKRLSENPKVTEAAFVGSLLFMKEAGLIHSYEVTQAPQAPAAQPIQKPRA